MNDIQQIQDSLNLFLNKTFDYIPNKFNIVTSDEICKTSDCTIYDLVLKFINDTNFQENVLIKLKEYTNKTKYYISGEHLKPLHFNSFLPKFKKYIETFDANSFNDDNSNNDSDDSDSDAMYDGTDTNFYVIEFVMHWEEYEISDIWAYSIINDGTDHKVLFPGSLYDYKNIIFKSIPHKNMIDRYGEDGFITALLIFMHWDSFDKKQETPIEIEAKKLAFELNKCNTLNELDNEFKKIPVNFHGEPSFRINLTEIIQKYLFCEIHDDEFMRIQKYNDVGDLMEIIGYKYVFGERHITRIAYPSQKLTKEFVFNENIEVISINEIKY